MIRPLEEETVLDGVYPKSEIFVESALFSEDSVAVTAVCRIPIATFYTARPILYVTAENYVRCLSQVSYLLAAHALESNLLMLDVPLETFLEAAANYQLYYRNLSMNFHRQVPRGESFEVRLSVTNARRIRRMGDFVIFTFENERTVISGEMSFVFVGNPC